MHLTPLPPLLLGLALALGACAAAAPPYRVGALPAAWRRVRTESAVQVYHHRQGGVLSASARCAGVEDVPLDVLLNHVLLGIEARRELARAGLTIAGRAALRARLLGTVDGVPIEMELVVLRKDGCTYDLQLVAGPGVFPARVPDFDAFLRGFALGAGR